VVEDDVEGDGSTIALGEVTFAVARVF